jgi:beta-glucanase (GH16 family)
MDNRKLLWSDEFDAPAGTPPNPAFWGYETGGHGWGNDELQQYTTAAENAFHDVCGNLVIRALDKKGRPTSARLTTKSRVEFRYGRIECRAKVAPGKGLWSAFWALGNNIQEVPWPGCGEIDILENIGAQPNRVFGTVHVPGASKESGLSGGVYLHHPPADGFHIFSVDWEPDRLTWQVDGLPYHSLTRADLGKKWIFDHPFYLMLNLAVGGWLGGELDPRALPSDFVVDFVRWYDLS